MGKLMGFSDFGSKPKKRKIDYQQEAQVSEAAVETGLGSMSGSGGNAIPLGRRRERKEGKVLAEEKRDAEVEDGERRHIVGGASSRELKFPGGNHQGVGVSNEPSAFLHTSKHLGEDAEADDVGSFRSQTGLEGYFHPSFIEDPWAKLR